ncbi:MAG: hypothetical protein K6G29_11285 [Clostridiales bacterium]|nr:hypothetical protein [Clostridia bacterium]MCR5683020.1 hypothetical protein [Clostridiales bacterium]
MKETKKKTILTICVVLLVVWALLFAVDTLSVANWKKPVFAVCFSGADDGGSGGYIGLGYSFRIRGNFLPDNAPGTTAGVTKAEGKLFGIRFLNRER